MASEFAYNWRIESYKEIGFKRQELPKDVVEDIKDRLSKSYLAGFKAAVDCAEKLNEISQDYNWKLIEDLKALLEPKS